MSMNRLKFRWSTLWLLGAVVVCAMEIYAAGGRGFSTAPVAVHGDLHAIIGDVQPDGARSALTHGTTEVLIGEVGESTRCARSAIVVLGNAGSVYDGAALVTLKATRIDADETSSPASCGVSAESGNPRPATRPRTKRSPASPPVSIAQPPLHQDSRRIYFLPTAINSIGNESGRSAIPCRLSAENSRVRVYVDERLPRNETLTALVNAVDEAAASRLGDIVHELVGSVSDLDQDGHLTVVVTPEVVRLGSGRTPVDGLTSPADFLRGIDRPFGNNSDVIFLSSHLQPGDQLRAVLAHEWCHAAVFSRRGNESDARTEQTAVDDWLNEALAHIVEVRASGSQSNLSHRIDCYRSRPGDSPLVVRDYSQPDFWRHDGCRGAAFLFLQWCLDQSDDSLLERMVSGRSLGTDGLEAATGRSFDALFLGWTTSLGRRLADESGGHPDSSTAHEAQASMVGLNHQRWRLDESGEQTVTLRIRGSCAEFVRIECVGDSTWRLSAIITADDRLQATLIPVDGTAGAK